MSLKSLIQVIILLVIIMILGGVYVNYFSNYNELSFQEQEYEEKNENASDISKENVTLKEVISEFNNDEIISESKLFLKTHIEKSENAAMKIENKDIRNILLDLNRYLIERSN